MENHTAPTAVLTCEVMGMYESPIKIFESAIDSLSKSLVKDKEDAIVLAIHQQLGVDVDRGELLRALQYDRFQYEKGYADGKADAEAALVRCKDCKKSIKCSPGVVCSRSNGLIGITENDFCSYGERREGE